MKYIDTGCMVFSLPPEPITNGAPARVAMAASAEQSITTLPAMNWRPLLLSMITPVTVCPSSTGVETGTWLVQ